MDDEERNCILAWQQGDENATCTLFDHYFPQAVRLGVLNGLRLEDSQDCAQDAFIRAFSLRRQLRDPQAFPLWFHRIATSRIMNMLNKPQTLPHHIENDTDSQYEYWECEKILDPEEILLQQEIRDYVWELLQEISVQDRMIIVLRYYADFSLRDIAHILDIREGTLRVSLHRALRKLRIITVPLEKII